jgi:hypothetical protein
VEHGPFAQAASRSVEVSAFSVLQLASVEVDQGRSNATDWHRLLGLRQVPLRAPLSLLNGEIAEEDGQKFVTAL